MTNDFLSSFLTDHMATEGIVCRTDFPEDGGHRRVNPCPINPLIYLSQLKLEVVYTPGRFNFVPDALSCLLAEAG
ncbi:hypothetical protein LY78DRAFT_654484 [Colletotrichum sublineola]|nr:hypothetical protein LY78DRAFT_654484 [Colletotrichum sublineola]